MAAITFKCPNCGGGLKYDPTAQKYQCEYCISEFTQNQLDEITPVQDQSPALLYTCPSCGAEVVTDETTAATFCFYCQNPVVLSGRLDGKYHPDYVIPFALEKDKAVEIFNNWVGKKRYVPKGFFAADQVEKMTGVYFPYWLYQCKVDGTLDAEAVKLRVWRSGSMEYTETQKFSVSRGGSMEIRNLARNALNKADKQLVEGVLPFEMNQIKPFSMGYLSGFMAEKRDMEQQEFELDVETEVKEFAASSLQNSIGGYQSISVKKKTMDIQESQWKYVLMPVWTMTYRNKQDEKIYYFACNGQTGKVCGKLPVDKRRLAWLFGQIFVPLMVIMLAVGYLI